MGEPSRAEDGGAGLAPSWTRYALLGGVVFVVLFVVGVLLSGVPDTNNAAKAAEHFATHRQRILAGDYIASFGLIAFVVWAWAVKDLLDSVGRGTQLGLAVLIAATLTAAVEFPVLGLETGLAYISNQPVDPQVARAFVGTAQAFSYVDYFPTVLLFGSLGWAILESRLINRWFAFSAFAVAALNLVVAHPGLGADLVGSVVDFAWLFSASIALFVVGGERVGHRGALEPRQTPSVRPVAS